MAQANQIADTSPHGRGRPSNTSRQQQDQGSRNQPGSVTAAHQNRGNSQYAAPNQGMSLDFEDEVVADSLYPMRSPGLNNPPSNLRAGPSQARAAAPMTMATPTRPSYTMNEAQALKAMLPAASSTIPFLHKNTVRRRNPVEQDPENHEIKRLRQEERLSWNAIANILNVERIKHGGEPTHTDASVYSRFVRNGPRIAQMQGETLNPKEWMHLKDEKAAKEGSGGRRRTKWEEQDKVFLVEAFGEVQQGFWEMVAQALEEKSGKKFEAKECAEMYVRI
jgi:hypothetical protein